MSGPTAPPAAGPAPRAWPRAWIVFCDNTELAWLRLLRPGFRHCFAVLHDGERWIAIDPLATRLEVTVPPLAADFDLPGWFAGPPLFAFIINAAILAASPAPDIASDGLATAGSAAPAWFGAEVKCSTQMPTSEPDF